MPKIRIKDDNLDVIVKTAKDVAGIDRMIDLLIVPALLGLGYSERLISQYIQSGVLDGNKE